MGYRYKLSLNRPLKRTAVAVVTITITPSSIPPPPPPPPLPNPSSLSPPPCLTSHIKNTQVPVRTRERGAGVWSGTE
ncbi:hypothetical protein SISNIDRAFT_487000 [Sistotremastrum niveocremeum HHB9708]|uniref:Uncharacterized protein n=1 Tax=Sistotremastrum niveocremeum HHB9708 TaxID=1314777 RepID=A0A164T4E1_9AGAM|nr:hypothetical protein SISNIDRAFT_487000 [Sistotremastrum niveocremeum HHB9708]